MLDFDLFRRVVDEAGPSLGRIDFFNYGEAFLHKRAVEMCEYIKTQLPAHLSLHQHQRPGAHRGAGAAARALGHRRGDVLDRRRDAGQLRANTGSAAASTSRSRTCARWPTRSGSAGRDLPFLNWRYILFNWNDSDEEMDARAAAGRRDRRRSPVLGDHRSSRGRVLAPVRARARRTTTRSGTRSGTTTTSATRFPARRRGRGSTCATLVPGVPLIAPRRPAAAGRARACTTCRRAPFPAQATYGRRLVRLGAQLCDADGALINRDFARAWLPRDARRRRRRADVPIEIPAPEQPGRYALKFDLVSEGIDWFERCGSQTTTKTLWVR